MKLKIKLSIALIMSLMLVACGGGSSSKESKKIKVLKLISEVTYNSFPGGFDLVTNTYDKNGYLIKKELDKDGNGILEGSEKYYAYAYKQGLLFTRSEYRVNGSIHTVETFNEQGDLVKKEYDFNGDGKFTQTNKRTYTYDTEGRKLTVIVDFLDDEGEDLIIIYYYDGNKQLEVYDVDVTNKLNIMKLYTYDDKGDLIKLDESYFPKAEFIIADSASYADMYALMEGGETNFDRNREKTYSYAYNDETGNLEMKTVDEFADGSRVTVTRYQWEEREITIK